MYVKGCGHLFSFGATVFDIELTLNRWGFYRPSPNKIQLGPIRFSWWRVDRKRAISFEVNWRKARCKECGGVGYVGRYDQHKCSECNGPCDCIDCTKARKRK